MANICYENNDCLVIEDCGVCYIQFVELMSCGFHMDSCNEKFDDFENQGEILNEEKCLKHHL
jgi:hypothetical protein